MVISVPVTEVTYLPLAVTLGVAAPPAPAGLQLSVPTTVVQTAPGSVVVYALNGTENGPVTVSVGSSSITTAFDAQGLLNGMSVPVSVASPGTYTLTLTDTTTSATATQTITVSAIDTPGSIGGGGVPTPPTNVQSSTGVKKWVFQDPVTSDVYHFAINPNQMNSPFVARNIQMAHGTHAGPQRIRAIDLPATSPATWTFSGVIRAKEHHDALRSWAKKNRVIRITDHLGRTFEVIVASFNPTDRTPTPTVPWRGNFDMSCLVLREIR